MFWILLIIAIVAFLIGLLDANPNPFNKKDLEKRCVTSFNSSEAAKELAKWLDRRAWVCDFRRCKKPEIIEHEEGWNNTKKQTWREASGMNDVESVYKGNGLQRFIRLAHLLGCVVILRQVGTKDEEDEHAEQIVTSMREEFYYRNLF